MASMIARCSRILSLLETRIQQILKPPHTGFTPALALCPEQVNGNQMPSNEKGVLETILGDGFLHAVQKQRRSREKRKTRIFGIKGHFEDALPKKNIVACLDCGHWHESHTICGNCYEKVREETKLMKESMNEDDFKYNAPQTEVVYSYEGEEKERSLFGGKYIVEVPKKRPQWWSRNLLVKGRQS